MLSKIGFLVFFKKFNNGKKVNSPEPILKALTSNLCKIFAALTEKGVHKKVIFFFFTMFN